MGDTPDRTGVERLVSFARALRAEGVPAGTGRVLAFSRAVAALGDDPADLYWAGRATLVAAADDLPVYDVVFARHFADVEAVDDDRSPRTTWTDATDLVRPGPDAGSSSGGGRRASSIEVLHDRPFGDLDPDERERVDRSIERLAWRIPRRRSRRTREAARGSVPDLRRTMRRSMRTHGEPMRPVWRRRVQRPRRLVLLLDVSGSMRTYTRPLVRFAHAAVHAGGRVEAFTFGTRLTRVTPALRRRDPSPALAALGPLVPDWHGGTRIGESLAELIDGWGRRGPLRGAIVVICSDGLDRGDPRVVAHQMRRLALLAHRVVWVNPLAGAAGYEPLARGMAAAMPHVDTFLSGHNLRSLAELARTVEAVS